MSREDRDSYFQVIRSKTHFEHIHSYSGQCYGEKEALILSSLNELSQTNNLKLHRKQVSNRSLKIELPSRYSLYCDEQFKFKTSSTASSSNRANSPYSNMELNDNYTNLASNFEDGDDYYIQENTLAFKLENEKLLNQFENNNYQTFLYLFNKAAIACYLKMIKATQSVRSYYSAAEDDLQTNFYILNENRNDKRLNHYLKDEEFITNYLNVIINMHMLIVNKLYKHFNAPIDCNKKDENNKHIFRSFRILGMRQNKKRKFSNQSELMDFFTQFSDIVDIRASFDITQFQNRTGYDCFIECEMNYYKITNNSIILFNNRISNIFN